MTSQQFDQDSPPFHMQIPRPDPAVERRAQRILDGKTKPVGSLGRLEELAVWYARVRGEQLPSVPRAKIVVFAADHGVADEGVSAYPRSVTAQMVRNFAAGGAAINVLTGHGEMDLEIVDVGVAEDLDSSSGVRHAKVAQGTANVTCRSAMQPDQCLAAWQVGVEVAAEVAVAGYGLVGLGEMGIGNTTIASLLTAALLDVEAVAVTGRGTGVELPAYRRKVDVVRRALHLHRESVGDPWQALQHLGGLELAALCGFIQGAASHRLGIVIDGFITAAAALVAAKMDPEVRPYLVAGHCSVEPGHQIILRELGLTPLLEWQLRLGEASGAALAIPLIQASVRILNEMASFGEANVDEAIAK